MSFSDFFDRLGDLDWLAVVVGAIVFMVIGWLWYGPLFGKQWSAATGQAMETGVPATDKLVKHFVAMFVLSGAVNFFGVTDNFDYGMVMGILFGIFLIGAAAYSDVIWSDKSPTAWMIDTFFLFVAITIVYYVQGVMA